VSPRAYVALGSNLGEREARLAAARRGLAALPFTRLLGASRVEETPPLGRPHDPAYLNQMVALETGLAPEALLDACLELERAAGRVRRERWAPRTLDLDLVRYGTVESTRPELTLPHPGLADRDFWRRELDELHRLGL
jgi:2-amino-4-hydroxy-6-hydroxymethyldihydropteridine diphosphokinase